MSDAVGRRLVVLSVLLVVCAARSAPAQTACDRACLAGIADQYFAAMAAHDPKKAPSAPNARFIGQTQVTAVGDGLWKTASKARDHSKNGWTDFLR